MGALPSLLKALLFLSLLPALLALLPRLQAERPGPVALLMDAESLLPQAKARGETLLQALKALRDLGVNGVAFPERTVGDWLREGVLLARTGAELREGGLEARPDWFYLKGPAWLLDLLERAYELPTERVGPWLGFPVDVRGYPAFYDLEAIRMAKALGFYVAVRPQNHPLRRLDPGLPLVPEEAEAVVFPGLEALGYPYRLGEARAIVQKPVALIEGTDQAGVRAFPGGFLRLFSLNYTWQLDLKPEGAAAKYRLAARERGHRLLYLRPYPYPQETEAFLRALKGGLEADGIPIGTPRPLDFRPSPWGLWAWVGVLAGLGLLALGLGPLGPGVALGLFLLSLGYAGEGAGALLAALVFPVLGFLGPRNGLWMWLRALGYALMGALLLSALGTRPESLLGLEPFRGVGLTLLLPPLLVALSFLGQDPKGALIRLFHHPLRLGEVGLGLLALGLLALALLRRGNEAPLVLDLELRLRGLLQDLTVRPRFKEVFGHALFPLALLLPWPRWIQNGLLLLATLGMASILNTFSHFHTPFLISLVRTANGALLGLLLGLLGVILGRRLWRWWWG